MSSTAQWSGSSKSIATLRLAACPRCLKIATLNGAALHAVSVMGGRDEGELHGCLPAASVWVPSSG